MDQATIWTRRSNNKDKLPPLPTKDLDLNSGKSDSSRAFGPRSAHTSKSNPFSAGTPTSVKSPGAAGASAFGFGTGAFASFGQAKTPKTPGAAPGTAFDFASKEKKEKEREPEIASKAQKVAPEASADSTEHSLRNSWNIFYRPPSSSNKDYEKSIIKVASVGTIEGFWTVYIHLKRPSLLSVTSDYHIFKDGIRPVWEDDANKKGGKWIIRLKKGVADRYWEELLVAIVGDQFMEASEEVCGAVLSMRKEEDVLSIWTKNDGGRNVKIRETVKRVLKFPPDTNIVWRSHDESIEQRKVADEARQQQGTRPGVEKRRTSLYAEDLKGKASS